MIQKIKTTLILLVAVAMFGTAGLVPSHAADQKEEKP